MHSAAIIAIAEKPLIGASGKEGHTGKATGSLQKVHLHFPPYFSPIPN
jgi:hypothetical protein